MSEEVVLSGRQRPAYAEAEPPETSSAILATQEPARGFLDFIFRQHRGVLLLCATLSLLSFVIFKLFYPQANFIPDSESYIEAARANLFISTWPIGYSKFLRVFSTFFQPDYMLVIVQYLFLQCSVLFFVFSVLYHLRPEKMMARVILFFMILNPGGLVISNFVTADTLFISLSLIWVTQLLWMLYSADKWLYYAHPLVLFLCFIFRYNALYYPIISFVVFFFSKGRPLVKLYAGLLTVILLGIFIGYTGKFYRRQSGQWQLSAFGGWQLAADGLFGCRMGLSDQVVVPARFKVINELAKKHIDSLQSLKVRPDYDIGPYYLWFGPLRIYEQQLYSGNRSAIGFRSFAAMAPFYKEYGSFLIKNYPGGYLRYFVLPNLWHYFLPPAEFLSSYNMGKDSVSGSVKRWFGYKERKMKPHLKEVKIMTIYPALVTFSTISVCFLIPFIIVMRRFIKNSRLVPALLLIGFIYAGNIFFSVLASPIVLRYQLFPFFITFTMMLVIADQIMRMKENA